MRLPVNISGLLGWEANKLGDMVTAGSQQFVIPMNQRPWEWTKTQLDQLWGDLLGTVNTFFQQNKGGRFTVRQPALGHPHFFGAFVFNDDGGKMSVVDGQQRLVAVSMLIAAIRERADLISKNLKGQDQDNCKSLILGLTLWLESGIVSGTYQPRLVLDPSIQGFFENYIVKPKTQAERNTALAKVDFSSMPVHRRLRDGFTHLRESVLEYEDQLQPEEELTLLQALTAALSEAFICLELRVKVEAFSYSVFGCLNARGTPLTDADKIKNELFARTDLSDHGKVKDGWDRIVERVPRQDMSTFLRFHHVAFVGPCPKGSLFHQFLALLDAQSPLALLGLWQEDAEWLQRIDLSGKYSWKRPTKEVLESVKTLGISYTWPALMSAARRFAQNDADMFFKIARVVRNFAFRTLTIEKRDVSFLEDKLGDFARRLASGGDPAKLTRELAKADPDGAFRAAFKLASERRVKIQYYILFELERHLNSNSGLQPAPHSPQQHVEHILPKRLSSSPSRLNDWKAFRDPRNRTQPNKRHEAMVSRLGNLLILEADINHDVSNYDFDAKLRGKYPPAVRPGRKSYRDSQLSLVGKFLKKSYQTWDQESIDDWQGELAKLAVRVWDLQIR